MHRSTKTTIGATILAVLFASVAVRPTPVAAQTPPAGQPAPVPSHHPRPEMPVTFEKRTKWFQDAKFGMFIHWGVYSMLGKGEWIKNVEKIPTPEYDKLVPRFNPTRFDPARWLDLAEAAGQKYIVITSKHHDGFCMFDSQLTDYDIAGTRYHRDVLKMLTDECHRRNMPIGFYYSILDWHHPDYLPWAKWRAETQPAADASFDRYLRYMNGQLEELLTNYGPLACIWFDGGWDHTAEQLRSGPMITRLRSLQPQLLINDRANLPADFGTPEQYVPATGMRNPDGTPRLWEVCMTMTSKWWGYDEHETDYKPTPQLIRTLIDVVSKGGNLLLNVGPRPDGTIQPEFVDRLYGVGAWMYVNGEAIYGTRPSPFTRLPFFGRCTVKEDKLYLHVFEWPTDRKLRLPGLQNGAGGAYLLPYPEKPLAVHRISRDEVVIDLPERGYDPVASVVVVELDGPPEVVPVVIKPDASNVIRLPAMDAEIHAPLGQRARHEAYAGEAYIADWVRKQDIVRWTFHCEKAADYEVRVTYAAKDDGQSRSYIVSIGKNEIEANVEPTGGPLDFQTRVAGRLACGRGENVLSIRAAKLPGGNLMNLRGVELREAPPATQPSR